MKKSPSNAAPVAAKAPFVTIEGHQFKAPTVLLYSNAFDYLQKKDFYEVVNTFVQNLYIKEEGSEYDLRNEEVDKIALADKILGGFFAFKELLISTKELSFPAKFKVEVKDTDVSFTLRNLERGDYKELFNRSLRGPLEPVKYILDTLYVEGKKPSRDSVIDFVSLFPLASYLLSYKEYDLKKK